MSWERLRRGSEGPAARERPVVLLVNGPNLNTLGTRQPEIYGTTPLEEIVARCREIAEGAGVRLVDLQSNHEGTLIDFLQEHAGAGGAIINPGGLAHTSVALRDAVAGCAFPVVEVHISDITAREPFRRTSFLSDVTARQVIGQGVQGYELALRWLLDEISKRRERGSGSAGPSEFDRGSGSGPEGPRSLRR